MESIPWNRFHNFKVEIRVCQIVSAARTVFGFPRQQRRCARFEQAASADLFCKRNFGSCQVLRPSSTPSFEAPVRSRISPRSATAGWTPRDTASRTRLEARRTSHRPGTLRLIDGTPLGWPMSASSGLKIGRNSGAWWSSPDALKHVRLALARGGLHIVGKA